MLGGHHKKCFRIFAQHFMMSPSKLSMCCHTHYGSDLFYVLPLCAAARFFRICHIFKHIRIRYIHAVVHILLVFVYVTLYFAAANAKSSAVKNEPYVLMCVCCVFVECCYSQSARPRHKPHPFGMHAHNTHDDADGLKLYCYMLCG